MKLSTAVWHIANGKPILDPTLRSKVIEALRSNPNYLKPIFKASRNDYEEKLTPKLEKQATKYREEVKLSPNSSSGMKVKFIMLHHSAGSFLGSVSWILNDKSDVSYHYMIDPKDGSRVQHVWDSKKAWHAGRSSYGGYTGLNSYSIGISFAGDTYKRDVADFEIDSVARKCMYLMDKYDLEIDAIITHQMAAPNRKDDCSPVVYKAVIARVEELIK